MALYVKTDEKTSAMMRPASGSGLINVVHDYPWTISNNRAEVPVATVTEYQINSGQLMAGLYYYGKQIVNTVSDTISQGSYFRGGSTSGNPYEFMYFANPTGFNYIFPWLKDSKFERGNSFELSSHTSHIAELGDKMWAFPDPIGPDGKRVSVGKFRTIGKFVGATSRLLKSGLGIASGFIPGNLSNAAPQHWTNSTGQNYTIEFDLLNTYTDSIRNNRELAYLLMYQNSPYRRNFAVIDPVCIYQLSIPDVVHLPACYVSNLSVTNLGNTRLLKIDGENRTVPEAYRFSISFSSLIEESRNIFWGVENSNDKISAISTQDAFQAAWEGIQGDRIVNGLQNIADRAPANEWNNNPDNVGPPPPSSLLRE